MLTHQRVLDAFFYEPDTGILTWRISRGGRRPIIIGDRAGRVRFDGRYRVLSLDCHHLLEHRLIWFYVHGKWPKEIDHINRDGLDNRLCNLREVTHFVNSINRKMHVNNTSGVKGVKRFRNKWMASFGKKHLGVFETKDEAAAARERYCSRFVLT